MKQILVTGGTGFIGSHVVHRLLDTGYSVVILDNLSMGKFESLSALEHLDRLRLVKGDVRDSRTIAEALDGADLVLHFAAINDVDVSISNPIETNNVNVGGTINTLSEATKHGVKRFLFASSAAVYGNSDSLLLQENNPLHPLSPYGASKASAEFYCKAFFESYGLHTIVLRYFNVYGPRQGNSAYTGVIERFVARALDQDPLVIFGEGDSTRDFIYIEDVVEATLLALEKDRAIGKTLNVCTGKPTTVNDLANTIREITGSNSPIVHIQSRTSDIRFSCGDPAVTNDILGFKARVKLKDGLRKYIESIDK